MHNVPPSPPRSYSMTAGSYHSDKHFVNVIRNFIPAWFAVVMGTGAVDILFHAFPYGKGSQGMKILTLIFFSSIYLFSSSLPSSLSSVTLCSPKFGVSWSGTPFRVSTRVPSPWGPSPSLLLQLASSTGTTTLAVSHLCMSFGLSGG